MPTKPIIRKKQTGKRLKSSSGDMSDVHYYLRPDFLENNPDLKALAEKIAAR